MFPTSPGKVWGGVRTPPELYLALRRTHQVQAGPHLESGAAAGVCGPGEGAGQALQGEATGACHCPWRDWLGKHGSRRWGLLGGGDGVGVPCVEINVNCNSSCISSSH